MSTKNVPIGSYISELLRRHKVSPNRLAKDLGISHVTLGRWLSGEDIPNVRSCQKIARFSGESLDYVLHLVGHLPGIVEGSVDLPSFREYARKKYPDELDEDLIVMIEDLIERRRAKKHAAKRTRSGK
jgi:transcriptional regulator with XRE-family HTH domain